MSPREQLAIGLARLQLVLPNEDFAQLIAFVALLGKWNRTYNLTAIREPSKVVSHHILDSLAVLPYVRGDRIADVGSGPGFPGIPIAVARPRMSCSLIESNHKKSAFLRQCVTELGLRNVEVVTERVENWMPSTRFDSVISRAFADLNGFIDVSRHLCAENGVMLAMKGLYPDEELAQLQETVTLQSIEKIEVPGISAARHLVILTPNGISK
jgi:16S rRNA (guanine527-N7)-methyltransferase